MIVLRIFIDLEYDCNFREKAFYVESREVGLGIENEPVSACGEWFANQEERLDATIIVGPGVTQLGPALVSILRLQKYCYATSRSAARYVEYVRRDGAHGLVWSLQSGVPESTTKHDARTRLYDY
jgi:hypothetical protein